MTAAARRATTVWAALVAATLVSWWLAERHGIGAATVPALMLIALVKIRLVFLEFMELGHMTGAWRVVFEAWVAGCAFAITAFYLAN